MTTSSESLFIELNAFLKIIGKASTGGQAKTLIRSGVILVNGTVETRNKKKLYATDTVVIDGKSYAVASYIST